jgi:hypothetical protein
MIDGARTSGYARKSTDLPPSATSLSDDGSLRQTTKLAFVAHAEISDESLLPMLTLPVLRSISPPD